MNRVLLTLALAPLAATLPACSDSPPVDYRFVGTPTACETLDWARERDDMLEAGDTIAAGNHASGGCFRVETGRRVRVIDSEGGLPGRLGRWVLVTPADGEALEHLASAELRLTLGQSIRLRGWVRASDLARIE